MVIGSSISDLYFRRYAHLYSGSVCVSPYFLCSVCMLISGIFRLVSVRFVPRRLHKILTSQIEYLCPKNCSRTQNGLHTFYNKPSNMQSNSQPFSEFIDEHTDTRNNNNKNVSFDRNSLDFLFITENCVYSKIGFQSISNFRLHAITLYGIYATLVSFMTWK